MDEEERYLFDLNGYLVVKETLSIEQVADINRTIDVVTGDLPPLHQMHTGFPASAKFRNDDPANGPVDVFSFEMLLWSDTIASLPILPKLTDYLDALLGNEHRLDHCYAILMRSGDPNVGVQDLHNGGVPNEPAFHFSWIDNAFDLGLVTVTFALNDEGGGRGGFGCIPGSHKANLPLPSGWSGLSVPRPEVLDVELDAGDALIFSEALTHGTLRWTAETQRRALLFKFMPGHLQWAEHSPAIPSSADDRLKRIVRPAFRSGRRVAD